MKRYSIVLLSLAVAALSACQKDSVIEEQPSTGSYIYTVNASIPETKSDYDDEGNFSWSAGDAISVLFHKDTDNKFFTLTRVSGTGNTATFSGSIDVGYTIGSSNTSKIFALYPASTNHSYTPGENSNYPSFYTPAVNDLTGEKYSANIPMYDVRDSEGDFTFKNMTCAYKFTITDLDVDKIQVNVHNEDSYYLSGLTTMSSSNYLRYGSGSKDISYILDVTSKTAVVYVSCRYGNDKHFRPTITIKDYATGYIIKQVTAANAVNIPDKKVKRLTLSAPGTGVPFISAFGIDWPSVTYVAAGRSDAPFDGIEELKATANASNLYLYIKVKKASTYYGISGYSHGNLLHVYLGNDDSATDFSWQWTGQYTKHFQGWLLQDGVQNYVTYDETLTGTNSVENGSDLFFELAIPRSLDACLSGTSAKVSVEANLKYVEGGVWKGDDTQIGFAPTTFGPALSLTMPTYVP